VRTHFRIIRCGYTDRVFYIGIVILFFLQVLFLFSPERADKINAAYVAPVAVAMFTYGLVRIGLPRSAVARLPVCLALWYTLTRVMNGDYYLLHSAPEVYALLLCCVLFSAAFIGGPKARAGLLRAVALAYCMPMAALAWIACAAAITGRPWVNPADSASILGVNWMYSNPYRLNFLGIHPNISAAYLYTALSLLIYLFCSTRKIMLRAAYLAAGIGLYLAIVLAASNAAIVATGLIAGAAVYAAVTSGKHGGKRRALVGVLAAVAAFGLVFASYPLLLKVFSANALQLVQEEPAQTGDSAIADIPAATPDAAAPDAAAPDTVASDTVAPEGTAVVDSRLNTAITSLSSRMIIFKSAFLSIGERPLTLLIGELREDAMERSARLIDIPVQNHMHNSFLQVLVTGGGLALLMAIGFTVLIVLYGVRLFFGKGVPLNVRLLVLAPAALLCHSMAEALLFVDGRIPNLFFFLLAGMIVAYSSELCPRHEKLVSPDAGTPRGTMADPL
jgi:hypothetical protein